jgi:hypothetical protein
MIFKLSSSFWKFLDDRLCYPIAWDNLLPKYLGCTFFRARASDSRASQRIRKWFGIASKYSTRSKLNILYVRFDSNFHNQIIKKGQTLVWPFYLYMFVLLKYWLLYRNVFLFLWMLWQLWLIIIIRRR